MKNTRKPIFDAWHDMPEVNPSPFEKQSSFVYTQTIFKKFQLEVLGVAACHRKIEKEDCSSIAHTIVVLQMSGVFTIPVKYVLQRWTNADASRIPLSENLKNVKKGRYHKSYKITLDAIKDALLQCSNVNNSAENEVNDGIAVTKDKIYLANQSELKALNKLEEMNSDLASKKEQLSTGMKDAARAKEAKLAAKQELRI
ncbi:protein FAR1-related sequence 4 isoform X1 [Tanacetum coccineum]|uniref:Protein FAR1-RELATED SEQUENCE n=1 Tax=Tanacetum coccineum TaxID=301880 RepID=A0ABQ5II15_9ASTR